MSDNKKVVEDKTKKEIKEDRELMNEFVNKYKILCEKYGFQIVVTPAYKLSQDTGTWSTVLQTSVGKLPKPLDNM